jgi:hypothetical protein
MSSPPLPAVIARRRLIKALTGPIRGTEGDETRGVVVATTVVDEDNGGGGG